VSGIEEDLAEFALGLEWTSLPDDVQAVATDLLLDALACAIAGYDAPARDAFAAVATRLSGPGEHLVINGGTASLSAAVMTNAWQTTALTMCDVYRPAMCHVTPVVVPALLAAAETSGCTRDEFLSAFVAAVEVTVRLCAAMRPDLYGGARWHAPGVIGPFGSATAAGLIAGLDAATLRSAWGLALLQSSGTFSAIGSPGVKFTQARAALAGVIAVEFARAGSGGSSVPFTHPDGGLFDAYGADDTGRVTRDLGSMWEFFGISLRRWPAASSLQSVIEAVLDLRQGHDGTVAELTIELPPQSYKLCAGMPWRTQLEALQSARWVAAVVWADSTCWVEQFAPASLTDAATADFASTRVIVVENSQLAQGATIVSLSDGRSRRVDSALGTPDRPLGRSGVLEKLTSAAGAGRAATIVGQLTGETLWNIETLRSALGGDAK